MHGPSLGYSTSDWLSELISVVARIRMRVWAGAWGDGVKRERSCAMSSRQGKLCLGVNAGYKPATAGLKIEKQLEKGSGGMSSLGLTDVVEHATRKLC
jgi:hypothetical protein